MAARVITFAGVVILLLWFYFPQLVEKRPDPRAACANNLRALAISFNMYANDDPGERFPPISSEPGRIFVDHRVLFPTYAVEPLMAVCPNTKIYNRNRNMDTSQRGSTDVVNELFDDHSYFYLPYATLSDDDIDAFGQAYRDAVARGVPLTEPILEVTNSASGTVRTLIVLRKGAERWFVTDEPSPGDLQRIKAGIPVIVERPGHHAYSDGSMQGGFVLYFDGHVDFVPYGTWPMTEKTIRILNELDALGARDTIEP